jgi:hypothetical protein
MGSVCAHAVPVELNSGNSCAGPTSPPQPSVLDVSGNNGAATGCWGTFDHPNGNDPGPNGDGFEIDGHNGTYDFVAKLDIDGSELSGAVIGLTLSGTPGTSGGWSFTSGTFGPLGTVDPYVGHNFIIVLKAASSYAAWFFSGAHANSDSGTWNVAWENNGGNIPALSHLFVYSGPGTGPGTGEVSEPSALALLGLGLFGLVLTRRRMPSAR